MSWEDEWRKVVAKHALVTEDCANLIANRGQLMLLFAHQHQQLGKHEFAESFRKIFGAGEYEIINAQACVDYYLKREMVKQTGKFFDRGAIVIEINPGSGAEQLFTYLSSAHAHDEPSKSGNLKAAYRRASSHYIGADGDRVRSVGITAPTSVNELAESLDEALVATAIYRGDAKGQAILKNKKAIPNFLATDRDLLAQGKSPENFKHYHDCLFRDGEGKLTWLRKNETEGFSPLSSPLGSILHAINYLTCGKVSTYGRFGEERAAPEAIKQLTDVVAQHYALTLQQSRALNGCRNFYQFSQALAALPAVNGSLAAAKDATKEFLEQTYGSSQQQGNEVRVALSATGDVQFARSVSPRPSLNH